MSLIITPPQMYGYQFAGHEPSATGVLYDYVLGGNGLFIRAKRDGLRVCFPFEEELYVLGLPDVVPSFEMAYARVPVELTTEMLALSEHYGKQGLENLFHFTLDEDGRWEINNPAQERGASRCRPLEDGPGSTYERAFIEAHSHHSMAAYFSGTDNADETGFRIYAVVGEIFRRRPKIRVRVGVYGHFWEIPAAWVFELPDGLIDCVEGER